MQEPGPFCEEPGPFCAANPLACPSPLMIRWSAGAEPRGVRGPVVFPLRLAGLPLPHTGGSQPAGASERLCRLSVSGRSLVGSVEFGIAGAGASILKQYAGAPAPVCPAPVCDLRRSARPSRALQKPIRSAEANPLRARDRRARGRRGRRTRAFSL
jgi:hypothetical protein